MGRPATRILAAVVILWLAVPSHAGVRIEEDEVIFTLAAPASQEAFLVGDFNNWNPTLEKMELDGGVFTVRLFMLPGTYHYKFVVDGVWIVDPDNRPEDPAKGSVIVLEERAGMLAMATETPEEAEAYRGLVPSLRYIGRFEVEDGERSSPQNFDVFIDHASKHLRASADLQTGDDRLRWDPLSAQIDIDRAYLDVTIDRTVLRAIDNDSVWTSDDPFRTVGEVGVYRYTAGYGRRGATLVTRLFPKTTIRALYTDKSEERLSNRVVIPASAFDGFGASTEPDTTVYRFDDRYEDSDTWALELSVDLGSLKGGYLNRRNRGLHPGTLAEVTRGTSDFSITTTHTREDWDADVFWLGYRVVDPLTVHLSYGRSDASVRREETSVVTADTLTDVSIARQSFDTDEGVRLQTTDRVLASIDYADGHWQGGMRFEWSQFDFANGVVTPSRAQIWSAEGDTRYRRGDWDAGLRVGYIDQQYGDTPTEFHVYTPARNFWLDYLDRLDVGNMVAFDLVRATDIAASVAFRQRGPFDRGNLEPPLGLSAALDVDVTASGVLGRLEYASARAAAEMALRSGFYAGADIRLARYEKPSWGLSESFVAPYFELGYRRRWLEASLGFGFDPVVLDRVPNRIVPVGRSEFLREAVVPGLRRDEASALGERLRDQEKALQDDNTLKLEVIVVF